MTLEAELAKLLPCTCTSVTQFDLPETHSVRCPAFYRPAILAWVGGKVAAEGLEATKWYEAFNTASTELATARADSELLGRVSEWLLSDGRHDFRIGQGRPGEFRVMIDDGSCVTMRTAPTLAEALRALVGAES